MRLLVAQRKPCQKNVWHKFDRQETICGERPKEGQKVKPRKEGLATQGRFLCCTGQISSSTPGKIFLLFPKIFFFEIL